MSKYQRNMNLQLIYISNKAYEYGNNLLFINEMQIINNYWTRLSKIS